MKILIRKAERSDLTAILALVQELANYENEPQALTAKISDYEKAFDEGLISVHLAEDDGKIVGMALFYMTFSTWKGHMLYLEDFYVKEEYRSQGAGQLLFDAYIATAKERNCKLVKWEVLDWNKKAIKFYERNGATVEDFWWDCKIIF